MGFIYLYRVYYKILQVPTNIIVCIWDFCESTLGICASILFLGIFLYDVLNSLGTAILDAANRDRQRITEYISVSYSRYR